LTVRKVGSPIENTGISRASVCRLMKEASTNPDVAVAALAENMSEQGSAAGAAQ
jgi:hypothetical protein